jgi:lambda family phage portal protein
VRTGIEFDPYGRRVAYHLYKENPGETMLFPLDGLSYARVPAEDMIHTYKPKRAGQLRGEPFLASTLALLYELEQYTDAALVKKKIQTMFAAFIEKIDPNADVLPVNGPLDQTGNEFSPSGNPNSYDLGTEVAHIETGTVQNLFPGEKVVFPTLPTEADFESFLRVELHKFAVGIGATYEQITGDLKGVNYSSIRAGLLDFRRKCEQFQRNVLIQLFCVPIVERWVKEAVLAGVLALPGYAQNPWKYMDITWSTPAWPWVDPLKDGQAAQMSVRNGFTSRRAIVAESGEDVAMVDAQNVQDNERAEKMGLIYDSNPSQVLIGRETNPSVDEDEGDPGDEKEAGKETGKGEDQVSAKQKQKPVLAFSRSDLLKWARECD